MEPRAVAGRLRRTPEHPSAAEGLGVSTSEGRVARSTRPRPRQAVQFQGDDRSSQRLRSALVAGALAACVVGLVGFDGGLIWVVAGVWTVRSVWRSPPGFAWGLLCVGIGARWGTLSVGDVESAARIFGPAATAGSPVVHMGMVAAIAAALVSEAGIDGLRSAAWAPRAAAFAAGLALVGLAAAPGPGRLSLAGSLAWWAAAGVGVVVATLVLTPAARRLPGWLPPVVAVAGVAVAMIAS